MSILVATILIIPAEPFLSDFHVVHFLTSVREAEQVEWFASGQGDGCVDTAVISTTELYPCVMSVNAVRSVTVDPVLVTGVFIVPLQAAMSETC